jgi:hypothetical protein
MKNKTRRRNNHTHATTPRIRSDGTPRRTRKRNAPAKRKIAWRRRKYQDGRENRNVRG